MFGTTVFLGNSGTWTMDCTVPMCITLGRPVIVAAPYWDFSFVPCTLAPLSLPALAVDDNFPRRLDAPSMSVPGLTEKSIIGRALRCPQHQRIPVTDTDQHERDYSGRAKATSEASDPRPVAITTNCLPERVR